MVPTRGGSLGSGNKASADGRRSRRNPRPGGAGLAPSALPGDAPIPGTSSVAPLEENVAAAGLTLSEDELGQLEDRS